MRYTEYNPSEMLKPYVKCYYELEGEPNIIVEDNAFATGCIEIMFTLDGAQWQTKIKEGFVNTPKVELWGQVLQPLSFRTTGKNRVFGIRFYPATASILLDEHINQFNDGVFDLTEVMGNAIKELLIMLQEAASINQRIKVIEVYLLGRLTKRIKSLSKLNLVRQVMNELALDDFSDNISNVAERHGITSRYLQKIFLQYTGLTPKLYSKINRFQNTLILLDKGTMPLTSIAYECGYFDQSHFIREFRTFTGFLPSGFDPENSSAILASPNK